MWPPALTRPGLSICLKLSLRHLQETNLRFACGQDDEDFLFEKGDLNLWAEPTQWVKLLHRNLTSLVLTTKQSQASPSLRPDHVHQRASLRDQARAGLDRSQRTLDSLPDLPQFSCTTEHAWLTLRQRRATLALDVLEQLR